MDLTGIKNENEFYTEHYLAAVLENDLKDALKDWREQDRDSKLPDSPLKLLSRYSSTYFKALNAARDTRSTSDLSTIQHETLYALLQIAGYTLNPQQRDIDSQVSLPLLGEVHDENGAPLLWILEALPDLQTEPAERFDFNALESRLQEVQYEKHEQGEGAEAAKVPDLLAQRSWEQIINKEIFALAEPPRWLLLCSLREIALIDRHKWNEKKLLRFDFEEILGRNEKSTLEASLALLHKQSLCPTGSAESLLDALSENAYKNAHGVTGDLKRALRESIELLGNEAIYYLSKVAKKKIYDLSPAEVAETYKLKLSEGLSLSDQLTREALRYMYRLLFLFYIEARPELGYAPINTSQTYLKGYSLESLRELENVTLTTQESLDGRYFDATLSQLFTMVYEGMSFRGTGKKAKDGSTQTGIAFDESSQYVEDVDVDDFYSFQLTALDSHLFDPQRTPLLNKVTFRNAVLQQVIRLMSLSKGNSKQRRGRKPFLCRYNAPSR